VIIAALFVLQVITKLQLGHSALFGSLTTPAYADEKVYPPAEVELDKLYGDYVGLWECNKAGLISDSDMEVVVSKLRVDQTRLEGIIMDEARRQDIWKIRQAQATPDVIEGMRSMAMMARPVCQMGLSQFLNTHPKLETVAKPAKP
jgi:hypothetical protein